MKDNRSIQRVTPGQPGGAIMTPQGPAIIQVIDIPSGGGGLGMPGGGMPLSSGRKVGGINIVGAILRRWWLVLAVTVLLGGAGIYVANNFIQPTYISSARVSWIDRTQDGSGLFRLVTQASAVLTSNDIPILIARQTADDLANGKDTEETRIFGRLLLGKDVNDPAVQAAFIKDCKEAAVAEVVKGEQLVYVQSARRDAVQAAAFANSFSRAFVKYCQDQMKGDLGSQITMLQQNVEESKVLKGTLIAEKQKLAIKHNFDRESQEYANKVAIAARITEEQMIARVAYAAAEAKLKALENTGKRRPDQELEAIKMIDEEKAKDNILSTYNSQLIAAVATLESEKALKTVEHPDVKRAIDQVNRMRAAVTQREVDIAAIIRQRIDNQFKLRDETTVAAAKDAMAAAQSKLGEINTQLKTMDDRAKELVYVKGQLEALDSQIALVAREYDTSWMSLQDAKKLDVQLTNNSGIRIAEYAVAAEKPDQDKRVKVQAAGMVGGLFLGMLLALLIDKFDKRLRDPRDVEPLLGAPLLGTIPKINELKRIKGEHARNLIAEEFRIIRTQLLFGDPSMQYKVIAVTSPQPGDGKTSLAVNLAISIAKAGRRVLLIDADLRKPDVHRIFNISDTPGFAEVVSGSHEPGSVIKKSDIEGLDVLPAGTPLVRPSELLSRPEVSRVLAALAEIYDQIILDTAPLLPVSDTHVLAGIVDGVMCSFNADVDRSTVTLVQEILRRSRANVIGTVMNQVKYKQSGSYQRGKSAYSSYYTNTRVPPTATGKLPGPDPNVATLSKQ